MNKSSVFSLLLSTLLLSSFGGLPSAAQVDQTTVATVAPAANSESPRLAAIRAMVRQAVQEQGIPGYAIAIVQSGRVVFCQTCGQADLNNARPVDENTIFGLASLTKTFTGFALLHLIDEGKVEPTDRLDKYLGNLPDSWKKMTIFQLASMRAGLPESRAEELPWPQEMRYLEGQPLAYEPDSKHVYSNPSYRVLGTVIEAVTGMPFLEYLNQTIFEPLQMRSTGTCESLSSTGRLSSQYVGPPGGQVRRIPPKDPATNFSAGMLASSLHDLCAYSMALLDHKILSAAAYQVYFVERPALSTGEPCPWAYGWGASVNPNIKQRVNGMNGGLPGVASSIMLLPDAKIAVVALANLRRKPVYNIAKRAMLMYVGADASGAPNEADAVGQGQ
ncbi:MAG: beta-lactamase family protein [Cyanobacteria bacterium REEB67]|nr:beta-lactamase family protein [Cyanobacteria bacterium REEB67]